MNKHMSSSQPTNPTPTRTFFELAFQAPYHQTLTRHPFGNSCKAPPPKTLLEVIFETFPPESFPESHSSHQLTHQPSQVAVGVFGGWCVWWLVQGSKG